MKRQEHSMAYVYALQSYCKIVTQSKLRKATLVTAKGNAVNTTQEGTESYSPENVIITDCTIFQRVSSRTAKVIHQILAELQFNNALWYFDHTLNTRDAAAIKELREKSILFPTEDTRIHYVNPDYIRKGNKLLVAANTAAVTATGKVCKTMIRPLNKKNIELNPMHLVELGH